MPMIPSLLARINSNDPKLTSVNLSYQNLTTSALRELVTALDSNTHVTALDLTGNPIGDEGAVLLSQNRTLDSLTLIGTQIGENGAIALAQHRKLTTLDISQNHIGNAGAIALAKNALLTTLKIAGNQINYKVANFFADNSILNWLDLSENQLNDKGASALARNKHLRTLLVAANQISDSGAIELAQHPTITTLVLHHNSITAAGAQSFTTNPHLTSLDLSYNQLGVKGASILAKSLSITSLFVIGNNINNVGIKELASNPILRVLDMSYNQVSDMGASAFSHNQTLQELNLSHNQLTVEGTKVLAKHPALSTLLISYNLLGDEGAEALAQSNSLTWLDLSGNEIGPSGAQVLAENTHLTKLVLSYNLLGDAGALMLAYNTTLLELWLSYNQIGDLGAIALARNQTLKVLSVNYNLIKEKGRLALTQNKYFQSLSISNEQPPDFTAENLGTIFALTQDLLCIRGSDDKIQFFNPTFSRVLGYADDELLNKPLRDFLHPDDRAKEAENSAEEQQKFPVLQRVYRYRRKDGSYRLIQWSSQWKHERIYASGIDITEQKQVGNKLIRSEHQGEIAALKVAQGAIYNEKQSDFIAHLCHEVRNPLSGIASSLEVMKTRLEALQTLLHREHRIPSSKVRQEVDTELDGLLECLKDMEICSQHEETILNDNLDVAKMAERKLQLVNVPFDLKNAIHEVSRMLKGRADSKGLALKVVLPQEAVKVKGDPLRLKQILINLISNAIKFTDKGQVELALTVQEQTHSHTTFELRVTDTGIGLTEDEASKLFERFSQANANVGEQYGGSGLGLVIAKSLARLMGGDIIIESKKGEGSTFRCTIQCSNLSKQEQEKVSEALSSAPMTPQSIRKLTILVVDDNAVNRKSLGYNLAKVGHTCLFAVDGHEAITQSAQHPVDIILMDIMMPQLDGISAAREIRRLEQEKRLPHVPIIALTGNALETQRQEALGAGMDDYVTKPYKKEEILKKMAAFFPPAENPRPDLPAQIIPSGAQTMSQQAFWRIPASEALTPTPARKWMAESLRDSLYPLLDQLSAVLHLLNVQIMKPESRFNQKISRTGWQLYSITGKDEHWAVLNFKQEVQADNLVEAIQRSGAQVLTKKMKSGAVHAVVIVFSNNISLSTQLVKMISHIRTLVSTSPTL